MRRFLLSAFSLFALASGSALAADMPLKALVPPPPAPVYSWTGFYLNAGAGYGMWTADHQIEGVNGICVDCVTETLGGRGFLGTVGGGFDYQFSDHIVAGLLADYEFSNIKGTLTDEAFTMSEPLKETSSWAAGARIGWLVTPQIFSYVNAGATGTRFGGGNMIFDTTGLPAGVMTAPFNKTGWFLGGGTETTLAPFLPAGWFLRGEYRYSYYGSTTIPEVVPGLTPCCTLEDNVFKPAVQTMTASIVYKLNWTGH